MGDLEGEMIQNRRVHRIRLIASVAVMLIAVSVLATAADQQVLRDRIASLSTTAIPTVDGAPIAAVPGITKLYEVRNWEPAWTPAMIRQLYEQVQRSIEHGLNPTDFHAQQLGARLKSTAKDAVYRADTEILCTDALARLAVTIEFGKLDPSSLDRAWNFDRSVGGQDVVSLFNDALESGNIAAALEAIEPDLVEYDRLQDALVEHLNIQARGGWPTVPEGEGLKLGSTGPRVVALRERLKVTGDLGDTGATDPAVFGEGLEAAVTRFQRRHGIDADGKVGPRTLEELNVPVEARIDQIRANLERARWVFRDVEDTYVIVDIAGYRLDLVENGRTVWSTNVQVGKPYHATPVFKSTMKYIEFNPTWTIPPGILRNETLPAIRRDPSYLSRNNMSVVTTSGKIVDPATIDWAATAGKGFPYMIRQEPGTRNALGQVKFIFPNEYMVYLHDTPSKGLFARTERAFSHGCIRTQNPFDFAEHLLDNQGWDRARIDQVHESRKTTRVNLKTPVTVMLLYWTADVAEDGTVRFKKDVYGRDAKIIAGLAEPFRVDPPDGIREAVDGQGGSR
jgi:murein L,D-transpeptidase YcbB/YkuD